MSALPVISVIMPVHNAGAYVGEAIESILGQTFDDFEFIIIDDCSSDNSAEIVRSYAAHDPRIVFLQNDRNLGAAQTRNRGLDMARGSYIAFMDSDDLCAAERFDKQLAYFRTHPKIALCGTYYEAFYETDGHREKLPVPQTHEEIIARMLFGNPFALPSVMIRRDALETSGVRFRECLAEDYRFWIDLSPRLQMANLPEYLFFYRRWSQQTSTHDIERQTRSAQLILQEHLHNVLGLFLSDKEARIFTDFALGYNSPLSKTDLKIFADILRNICHKNQERQYCNPQRLRTMVVRRYKVACLRFYPALIVKLKKRIFALGL